MNNDGHQIEHDDHDNVDYRKSWGDNQNLVNHGNSLQIIKLIVKLDRS